MPRGYARGLLCAELASSSGPSLQSSGSKQLRAGDLNVLLNRNNEDTDEGAHICSAAYAVRSAQPPDELMSRQESKEAKPVVKR